MVVTEVTRGDGGDGGDGRGDLVVTEVADLVTEVATWW